MRETEYQSEVKRPLSYIYARDGGTSRLLPVEQGHQLSLALQLLQAEMQSGTRFLLFGELSFIMIGCRRKLSRLKSDSVEVVCPTRGGPVSEARLNSPSKSRSGTALLQRRSSGSGTLQCHLIALPLPLDMDCIRSTKSIVVVLLHTKVVADPSQGISEVSRRHP